MSLRALVQKKILIFTALCTEMSFLLTCQQSYAAPTQLGTEGICADPEQQANTNGASYSSVPGSVLEAWVLAKTTARELLELHERLQSDESSKINRGLLNDLKLFVTIYRDENKKLHLGAAGHDRLNGEVFHSVKEQLLENGRPTPSEPQGSPEDRESAAVKTVVDKADPPKSPPRASSTNPFGNVSEYPRVQTSKNTTTATSCTPANPFASVQREEPDNSPVKSISSFLTERANSPTKLDDSTSLSLSDFYSSAVNSKPGAPRRHSVLPQSTSTAPKVPDRARRFSNNPFGGTTATALKNQLASSNPFA